MKKGFKKVALGVLTSTLVLASMVPTSIFATESTEEIQYESAEELLQNVGDVRYYDLDLSYTDKYMEEHANANPYFSTLTWGEDGTVTYMTVDNRYKVVTQLDNEYLTHQVNYGINKDPEPYDRVAKVTDIKVAGMTEPAALKKFGYSDEEVARCQYLIVDLKDDYKVVHTYTADEFVALGKINNITIDLSKYPELQLRQEVRKIDGRTVTYRFSIVMKGTDAPYGAFCGGLETYKYNNNEPNTREISSSVWEDVFFTPEFRLGNFVTHDDRGYVQAQTAFTCSSIGGIITSNIAVYVKPEVTEVRGLPTEKVTEPFNIEILTDIPSNISLNGIPISDVSIKHNGDYTFHISPEELYKTDENTLYQSASIDYTVTIDCFDDNSTEPDVKLNGLNQSEDGNWYYYTDNNIDYNYNGVVENEYGWWKVTNGVVDFEYNGLAQNDFGWWKIANGAVDFTYNGLAQNKAGWWKITNGQVDFNFTGLASNELGWWYIGGGQVDFNYNGVVQNEVGWWKVTNGVVDFEYNGLAQNDFGWWKITNGAVDFGYNGLAENEYGIWNVVNGRVEF